MNPTNLDSPHKLTEFALPSPEDTQPSVTSFFTKFFSFSKAIKEEKTHSSASDGALSRESESPKLSTSESSPNECPTTPNQALNFADGRSFPNVLKRISNIVGAKTNNLQSYKDSELRSYWMPDSVSKQCYECNEPFTTFRRRHHCRVCGQIFCSKCCSDEIPGKIMGCTGDLRVCTYCCKVVLSYLQSSDMTSDLSSDLKALQEDLEEKYGNTSTPFKKMKHESVGNERRKISVGYMEEKYAFGRSSQAYLTSQERIFALQNSASLRMIYEELFRSSNGIPLQTHRVRLNRYHDCFCGSELVTWLIANEKAANRVQGSAIGQALFEANFIQSLLEDNDFLDSSSLFKPAKLPQVQSRDFVMDSKISCDAQEPAWVKNIAQNESTLDSENDIKSMPRVGRLPSTGSSFYLDLNIETSRVTLKKPSSEDLESVNYKEETVEHKKVNVKAQETNSKDSDELLNDILQVQEVKGRSGWHKLTNLKNNFNECSSYNSLIQAYKHHHDSLLKQLLSKEGLSQNWSNIITQISDQVIDHVRPDLNHNADDMDIRQYVQIKKSPGGNKNDSEIISGVICNKNIAHKNMNAMIANPKILLLRCGLMYQRVEGKLSSLEPVMLQENEYLGHAVARITALGPNIVITYKSVSRLAQDRLRECGVTLVLNVKISTLERLARCTNASIVDSIDAHISAGYKLGTCKKFYLRSFPSEKWGVKTLMYFEGCANPHLGASVLLRGGSENELKKVKQVALMIIFAMYSARLEISYLMDEFAKPPSPTHNSFLDESSRNNSPSKTEGISETSIVFEDTNKKDKSKTQKVGMHTESLNNSSALLDESYDTLRLFNSKLIRGGEPNEIESTLLDSERMHSLETFSKPKENVDEQREHHRSRTSSDEKRVHGECIVDKSDPLHKYLNEGDEVTIDQQLSPNGQCLSVAELPLLNQFKKALEGTILSISPYLKFSIPYLETEIGRNCILRNFFPKDLYYSIHFMDKIEGIKNNNSAELHLYECPSKIDKLKTQHPFVTAKLTMNIDNRKLQGMLANFRACGNYKYNFQPKPTLFRTDSVDQSSTIFPDCLDPNSHQRFNNAPAFCVNPWVVNMDLYGRNDIALGRFLERYCLTKDYKCPSQTCRAQISQHIRRFVHDGGCVYISLCEMSSEPFTQNDSDQIFMWNKCAKCKSVSPVIPIADDTWSLSFAKFLELRFHGNVYVRRGTENCLHSLHHDHLQYFSKRNMVAVIRYNKISQWEISLPPPLIQIYYDPKQYLRILEEIKNIAPKGEEVFSSIKEKLSILQTDLEIINALKQQLIKEQQLLKNKMEELQLKLTSPSLENKRLKNKVLDQEILVSIGNIEDGITLVKRLLAETIFSWDSKISDLTVKKKEEKSRKFADLISSSQTVIENDGYITEDTASESQIDDLSPTSADYNAVEAIHASQNDLRALDVDKSDRNILDSTSDEILITQHSPKIHDTILPNLEDAIEKKKKKKTILSQLLQSTSTTEIIPNPFGPSEHHLLPQSSSMPFIIYESEPSSIIAYALDSFDYKQALQEELRANIKTSDFNSSPQSKRKSEENKEGIPELLQSGDLKRPSVLSFLRTTSSSLASPNDSNDKNVSTSDVTNVNSSLNTETEEDKKVTKQNHIEVQFSDSTTNFFCRIYFAAQFSALRECVLPSGEQGYIRSLSRSILWAARGGKSGSTFSKTRDDRFILKEMSRMDCQIFLEFAPNYFSYMEKCQQSKQPTLLGKIVGIYRVSYKNNSTNSVLRTSVLVMENLFYKRKITDKFDLKGSIRNRLVNLDNIDREGELVLLDENLLNMSCDSPLYIRPHAKAVLNKAIEEDTKFLAANSVMDYSLLVGLEPDSDELVLGIIDYLRTFTWDKRLETMVKKSGILGGQGKLPTIVSPVEYRARFIDAMHKYFLPAPDRWTGLSKGVVAT